MQNVHVGSLAVKVLFPDLILFGRIALVHNQLGLRGHSKRGKVWSNTSVQPLKSDTVFYFWVNSKAILFPWRQGRTFSSRATTLRCFIGTDCL